MALPSGKVRYKTMGGLNGHNDLKSIAQHIKSQRFYRLGIGHLSDKNQVSHYVLNKPNIQQTAIISNAIAHSYPYGLHNGTQSGYNTLTAIH